MNNSQQTSFKKRHTFQERMEKSKKQMAANPGKIVIIVEKHPKSVLPTLTNPRYWNHHRRFLCEKEYKFNMIKNMIEKKIKESGNSDMKGKQSFFIFIKGTFPNPESTMVEIYDKYKDEDGFLYMQYGDQESLWFPSLFISHFSHKYILILCLKFSYIFKAVIIKYGNSLSAAFSD